MKVSDTLPKQTEQVILPAESAPQAEVLSNPAELLSSLKTKHQLFTQLKNEGLIHKDHLSMEIKLKETIIELEGLLTKLKEPV